jgi:hypothetical protein
MGGSGGNGNGCAGDGGVGERFKVETTVTQQYPLL